MPTIRITQNLLDNQDTLELTYNGNIIGSSTPTISNITSNTTLAYGVIYLVDTTLGNVTLTLPTAIGNTGKQISIRKIDNSSNIINIITTSGQTVNGDTNVVMQFQNTFITFVSDNINFFLS